MTNLTLEQQQSIDSVRVGDEIVGPWGVYHIRVTSTEGDYIEGVYTKVRPDESPRGYYVWMPCRYLKRDWHGKSVEFVAKGAE